MRAVEKLCTGCNQTKPASAFYRQKSAGDGLTSHCRECIKEERRRHYQQRERRKCVDCGAEISPKGTRCKSCSAKQTWEQGILTDKAVVLKRSASMKRAWNRGRAGKGKLGGDSWRHRQSRAQGERWARIPDDRRRNWVSQEQREAISARMKEAWRQGAFDQVVFHDEESLARQRRLMKQYWAEGRFAHIAQQNRSSLELEFEHVLETCGVVFKSQYQIDGHPYYYDFYLPGVNVLVEIDSDYWHYSEWAEHCGNKARDRIKDELAEKLGITLVRIREKDISEHGMENIVENLMHFSRNQNER